MGIADDIRSRLDDYLEFNQELHPRGHLGASIIGRTCEREIWYGFRWAKWPKHSARMLRLFERGHKEEHRFESWLTAISDKFWAVHPDTGNQFRVSALRGYFGGSLDGIVRNPAGHKGDYLTEFKTHGLKSFEKLIIQGVKVSKPEHYIQMQIYLHHYPKLKGAIYFAICKNDDALHIEFVEYDQEAAEAAMKKAGKILLSTDPPERFDKASTFSFQCKYFCDFSDICHSNVAPKKSCRNCEDIRLTDDGWQCNVTSEILSEKSQLLGCAKYKRLF